MVNIVEAVGFRAHPMPGATRTAIGITGNEGPIDGRRFENLAGVAEVIRVTKPYKLITLDLRPDKTVVRVGDATIGDSGLAIIAGPCGIESRDQAFAIAKTVQKVVRVSFVAVFGNLERRLTRSRAWVIKAGKLCQPFARSSG